MHLPDQDLAGLGSSEAALSGRRKASSVPRVQCAFRFKVHPAPGEVDVSERRIRDGDAFAGVESRDAATGMLRRINPGGSGLRLAAALAARPRLVAGRGTRLAGELARIAAGRSQVQPSRRDRRFADPGWAGNPLLRRTMQAYLAAAQTAEGRGGRGWAVPVGTHLHHPHAPPRGPGRRPWPAH